MCVLQMRCVGHSDALMPSAPDTVGGAHRTALIHHSFKDYGSELSSLDRSLDSQPENVLVTEDGAFKLGDFGVSIDTTIERAVSRAGEVPKPSCKTWSVSTVCCT